MNCVQTGIINTVNGVEIRLNLTAKESAVLIGCSEYKLKELARQKKVPHHRIGNRFMFTREGLEKWIEEQEKKSWTCM